MSNSADKAIINQPINKTSQMNMREKDNTMNDAMREDMHEMSSSQTKHMRKTVAAVATGAAALVLLSACGEPSARPMDDEFAGNSGETSESTQSHDSSSESSQDSSEHGSCCDEDVQFTDGDYAAIGQYGPVGEDTIDVYASVEKGVVTSVRVEGHPFTSISKQHQEEFAQAIPGVVEGKPLKNLKVDKVAGASWTSDAFNAALDEIRKQAASTTAQE